MAASSIVAMITPEMSAPECAGGLDVPRVVPDACQAQGDREILHTHGILQVLLVGQDEDARPGKALMVQNGLQLRLHSTAVHVRGV